MAGKGVKRRKALAHGLDDASSWKELLLLLLLYCRSILKGHINKLEDTKLVLFARGLFLPTRPKVVFSLYVLTLSILWPNKQGLRDGILDIFCFPQAETETAVVNFFFLLGKQKLAKIVTWVGNIVQLGDRKKYK